MDASVIAALAKWPNVPACYGWLALDARGAWRLGQEQRDVVRHAGLAAFLSRNYVVTPRGEWFVQNGPQRVYVELERAPYVAHHDGVLWRLHTGEPLGGIRTAHLDEFGALFVSADQGLAAIDDRDLALALTAIADAQGAPATDEAVHALIAGDGSPLRLRLDGEAVVLTHASRASLPQRYSFITAPQPEAGAG